MSEQITEHGALPGPAPEKLLPFIHIVKTPSGCSVSSNLTDIWLAIALMEMGKETLIKETRKPPLVEPKGVVNGMLRKMGGQ